MARLRTVKPEIHTDEKTGALSDRAFRLFIGLLNHADDYGVLKLRPIEWCVKIFAYQIDTTPADIAAAFADLRRVDLVDVFTIGGAEYVFIVNFDKHQQISHRSRPVLPEWKSGDTPDSYRARSGEKQANICTESRRDSGVLRRPPAPSVSPPAGVAMNRYEEDKDITELVAPHTRAREPTPPIASEREPDTPRLADVPGFKKIGDCLSVKGSGRGGRYADQRARDEFAMAKCKAHLPIGDALRREMVALAAEDPRMEGHDAAVRLMLQTSKRIGVGWVSPERRQRYDA